LNLQPGIKGSTFAKASFSSSNNRDDIDWEDPNFWAKWAQKANVDINAAENHLIMSEPRARRKRFEDNYKGLHEGENGSDEGSDDDGETSRGRGNRGSDFSKSRSGKKRRKDDDDDYVNYNAPDELTFNKSEFFKVSEKDIEHIGRTLLLHCIREYRGDEKSREFVWQLILPKGAVLGKGGKKGIIGGGLYHEGWATLPE
jgi:chromodomain-helicase-DNA-binding protein 7